MSNLLRIIGNFAATAAAAAMLASIATRVSATSGRAVTAAICESAAVVASRETGVPLDVLRAISLTETGRKNASGFLPWPWTVNMEGAGKWFDDRDAAQAYVDRHFARGARSFDVGCFQINYRWHGDAFSSIEEMFEPVANARYAASFLQDLHAELGDWSRAAGAYHSRSPKYAKKYRARFNRIRARLPDMQSQTPILVATHEPPAPAPANEVIARINRYPLLRTGLPSTSIASLVPVPDTMSPQFISVTPPRPILDLR